MQKSWLITIGFAAIVTFQNCGQTETSSVTAQGTFTGNAEAPLSLAANLASKACSSLIACQPAIDFTACTEAVGQIASSALGVSANVNLPTLSNLETAEETGSLKNYALQQNMSSYMNCTAELSTLSCSSSTMTSVTAAADFKGIEQIFALGADCAKVYSSN